MKAQKVTVEITMESLSIDTLGAMLAEVVARVEGEAESGKLVMADGDRITWLTRREEVQF